MASNVDPMTRKEVVIKKIREQNKAHGFVLCFAISPVMKVPASHSRDFSRE